jgi:hypothetical protein
MNAHEKKIIRNLLSLLQSSLTSQDPKEKKLREKKKVPLRDPDGRFCKQSATILLPMSGQSLKLKSSSITIRVTVGW